jgi:7,8-dihydropterin-6-yl-methyl-4-(beta-D-ribofuranosyl)aminobenzene 5'-phosphate synthase
VFEAWARTNDYQSGHGVSYLIKTDQTTLLLDVGNNELSQSPSPLAHNLQQLNQSIDNVDYIVISHNHPDHVGGTRWWRKNTFSVDGTQDQLNIKKVYLPVELSYSNLDPVIALEPTLIAPGIATLGRIPFIEPFPFYLWAPLGWEQSIVINVESMGLVIVSGCGHPGLQKIVKITEQTIALPVAGIVGGMHYLNSAEDEIRPDLVFLKERNPNLVALSPHDSSGRVLQLFEQAFPEAYRYIAVGLEISVAP